MFHEVNRIRSKDRLVDVSYDVVFRETLKHLFEPLVVFRGVCYADDDVVQEILDSRDLIEDTSYEFLKA